jgi:maleylpyruvate isomerase
MRLYNFFRSGTSHRTRIALNLKGLSYEYIPVNLRAGEDRSDRYLALNPQGLVPLLELEERRLMQSPAIIEFLEERWPDPPLLPSDIFGRARVRALAAIIGCDIHPINNLRILSELRGTFGADEATVKGWCGKWITAGFEVIEQLLDEDPQRGPFCYGDSPTLADVYLVPQVYSARRFEVDLASFPIIVEIDNACGELDAFRAAAPAIQPDAA